jgi:hypothetical protein
MGHALVSTIERVDRWVVTCGRAECGWHQEHLTYANAQHDSDRHQAEWHKDLGREAGKSTSAGMENGGAESVVAASTDYAPRSPALPDLLARLLLWDELLSDIGSIRSQVSEIASEVVRLTEERDRLQELLVEGQAAYDELAEAYERQTVDAMVGRFVDGGRRGD